MVLKCIIWYIALCHMVLYLILYLMVVFWLYNVILYAIVWHCIISYGIALYHIVFHCMLWFLIVVLWLYHMIFNGTELFCIGLYFCSIR